MERIIITGPTGAIGIALIQQCIQDGTEVYAVCRKNSKRIKRIPKHTKIHIREYDLDELKDISVSDIPKCDVFYHLGWEATTGESRNDMSLQLKNVQYTLDAVRVAERLGCKVFVGAGSQAEYGRSEGKLNESTPVFPENGYGMAKLCAGQMSRIECNKRGIKHIWTRILSVYGPYDNEASMIVQTIQKLLQGEKPVFTKAEQLWDYLYCEDAARALFLLGKSGKGNKTYCIGSGKAHKLVDYIYMLRDQINPESPLGIGEIPYGKNQVMYLCADIKDLQEDTGFQPKVSFEEGIRNTISWKRNERKWGGHFCSNNNF